MPNSSGNVEPLTDDELQRLYTWVDEIPLSRPKRNITRDFADACMFAEMVKHYYPKLVDLHNYVSANGVSQKLYNWETLNQKVLRKINFTISKSEMQDISSCVPDAVEQVLYRFQNKLLRAKTEHIRGSNRGSASKGDRSKGSVSMSSSGYENTPTHGHPHGASDALRGGERERDRERERERDAEVESLLQEREQTIAELRETIEILEVKTKKLEQLVRLKDSKIHALTEKLQKAGLLG